MNTRRKAFDVHVPFQRVRHSWLARWARRSIYTLAIGDEGYPFVFDHVAEDDERPYPASPNLYVHIPFCRSICAHCPYNKIVFREASYRGYTTAIERELAQYLMRPDVPPIETLYFGGGTPSMTPGLIERVIALTRSHFAAGVEIGVEVHPRDATVEGLARLRAAGVDRISLGIETFQEELLRILGRDYTCEEAELAIQNARQAGFACVDVNLIYGIPGQRREDALADAHRCIALGVDHLSAYPLITFAHTHLGRLVAAGKLREYGDRERARTQREIARACLAQGFARTSVWSFTRARASAYTTVTRESYVGFGAGAGSKVDGEFWFNTFSVSEYNNLARPRPAIRLQASEKFRRIHWLYWQIYRTRIDAEQYAALYQRDLRADFRFLLGAMWLLGWTRRAGPIYTFTDRGARWSHRVQMLFSLTFIDEVWAQCQKDPWPERIVLA